MFPLVDYWWFYAGFTGLVLGLLALDLGMFHRRAHAVSFLLAGAVARFHLLKYGLAAILIFVGLKMVWLNDAFGGKFPIDWSLGIIGSFLAISVVASLVFPARSKAASAATGG